MEGILLEGNRSFRRSEVDEVVELFNRYGVRYIVLGGQAMRLSGMPRFSIDWDVWVPLHDEANLKRTFLISLFYFPHTWDLLPSVYE